MNKKILIVSQYFWPDNFVINQFAEFLKKKNFNVEILTSSSGYIKTKEELKKKRKGKKHKYKFNIIPTLSRGNNIFTLAVNYISFVLVGIIYSNYLLHKKNFDYIFVYAPSPITQIFLGYYIKIIKRAKLIIWIQDLWPSVVEKYIHRTLYFFSYVINFFIKKVLNNSDLILCQSPGYLKYYKKKLKKKNIFYLPNFCDEQKKYKNKSIDKNKKFKIIYAGNIGRAQSIDTIIKCAKLIKEKNLNKIIFLIYGTGSKLTYLKYKIKKEKLNNITLYGYHDPKKMGKIYNSASALIITLDDNLGLNLTLPSRLQTFLYYGKPIIGAANGQTKYIIKTSKSGLCGPSNNHKELLNNIIKVMNFNNRKLELIKKNSNKFYKSNYEKGLIYKKFLSYLKKI